MTVAILLDLLAKAGCSPSVRESFLELADDAPDELEGYVELLQSGLRAKLASRRWFGIDANGRGVGPHVDGALDFRLPLPSATHCLTVEGDVGAGWDVIDPRAKLDLPDAFAEPSPRKK